MSILKIILIGILCLAPEKDGWVRINGDNYISFSFPSRGERFKKEVNNMRSWIFQTKNITCVFISWGCLLSWHLISVPLFCEAWAIHDVRCILKSAVCLAMFYLFYRLLPYQLLNVSSKA